MTNQNRRTLYKLSIVALLALVYLLFPPVNNLINKLILLFKDTDLNRIKTYILSFGIWAPIISFLLMVFQSIIAPLPAFFITLANATLFGWVKGALLSWSSAMTGALLCFYISRFLGRDVVEKLTSKSALKNIDDFFDMYGKYAVLIARLLPFVSFDIVSYAAGLTSMGLWSFLWSTGLGQLPATIIYSYAGETMTGGVRYLVIGLSIIFALSIIIVAIKSKLPSKKNTGMVNVKIHQWLSTSRFLTNKVKDETKIVFFPGCSLCETNPQLVKSAHDYLVNKVDSGIEVLLNCCSKPTASINDMSTLNKNIGRLGSDLKNCNEIITACPNCYVFLGAKYKDIKITSLWEIIAKYGIDKKGIYKSLGKDISIHDPCPIKSVPSIHDSVRKTCNDLGLSIADDAFTKDRTLCCGSKDMMRLLNPEKSRNMLRRRIDTLKSDLCVTYCMECSNMMQTDDNKTVYLLDLIFNDGDIPPVVKLSTKDRWLNRFKLKNYFDRSK